MEGFAKKVALALVKASPKPGRRTENDTDEERAENLLRSGKYGPYVADGDPHEWGGGGAVATIYMEQKGDKGDCAKPLDYYGDGFDVAFTASDYLGDYYIEFVNAAVAVVYPA